MEVGIQNAIRHFNAAERSSAMHKEAICPRRTRHRREPSITYGEIVGESVQCGKICVVFHDLSAVTLHRCGKSAGKIVDEPSVTIRKLGHYMIMLVMRVEFNSAASACDLRIYNSCRIRVSPWRRTCKCAVQTQFGSQTA